MLKYMLLATLILSSISMYPAGLFTSCENEYSDPRFSVNEIDSDDDAVREIIFDIVRATQSTIESTLTSIIQCFGTLQDTTISASDQTPDFLTNMQHPNSTPELSIAEPAQHPMIPKPINNLPEEEYEMITIKAFNGDHYSDQALTDREDSFVFISNQDENN